MNGIFRKRTMRELRAHALRYTALGLMITVSIYLIVSLIGAADTIIIGSAEHAEKNRIEDGQFTVFVPLKQEELKELADTGIETEAMFSRDYVLADESVLRIFNVRETIDLAETETGHLPAGNDEILLEKRYCEVKGIHAGDTVEIAGKRLKVSGTGTSPDYEAAFRSMGDSTVDSASFGTAFVSAALYDELADTGCSQQSEEYLYAYRLNGSLTDSGLKERLKELRFDPEQTQDAYFLEYWERTGGKRNDFLEAVDDLADGSSDLAEGTAELADKLEADEMLKMVLPEEFFDGVRELKQGGEDLQEGSADLRDAVRELLDRYWPEGNENLRTFVPAADNPRIGAAGDDVQINKYSCILAGVIIMILMGYVISVFVIHSIDEDSSVIGTLFALGVSRKDLLRHYLVLPAWICFLAGAAGVLTGYSRFGVPVQTADTYMYFSVPAIDTIVEPWVVVYGLGMPVLTAVLVNYIVIRKKLSEPVLHLIRRQQKRAKASQVDLGRMDYLHRFQLRQLIREGRSAAGVVFGIFICLLLMMIAVNAAVLCAHVGEDNIRDTKYEYMYLYKYPEETVPEGGYPAYAETLKKEVLGYNLDVTVLGLEDDNPFFEADPQESESRVLISSAMAQKYGIREGDAFLLEDSRNERYYAFTADGIVTYAPGFYVFMDIGSMRELFGADREYFNVVFSDHDLHIDSGRLYSISTREDVVKAADIFTKLMESMVYTLTVLSAIIMASVMYLMMKVMIDRSALNIALFKVFGYRKKELGRLYLNGNTVLITAGVLISIPLAKIIIDALYPYLVSNVACALNLHFEPWIFIAMFAGIMLIYALIHTVLVHRIEKINLNLVLKNRE